LHLANKHRSKTFFILLNDESINGLFRQHLPISNGRRIVA
jgi:hypothetical protein